MPLESIRALIQDDLQATDRFIIAQLGSNIPLIKDVIEYLLSCGGKRIRPMVLLLSARALSHHDQKHIDLAAVIELIHSATLLHDDVVDDANLRRGHKTAHTIWNSKTSVLVGDFLYSRAFQIVVNMNRPDILNIFASATHFIAEGEIMQLVNSKNPDTTETFYYEIIQRKTARLFEIATQLGAMLSTNNEASIDAMREFGQHLGLAYQLIDDAIDYSQSEEHAGKNVGQDLAEGKMTLPLIHTIKHSSPKDVELIKDAIQTGSTKHVNDIMGMIESSGAIQYTANAAKHHIQKAKAFLSNIAASPYRQALETLSDFVVARTY